MDSAASATDLPLFQLGVQTDLKATAIAMNTTTGRPRHLRRHVRQTSMETASAMTSTTADHPDGSISGQLALQVFRVATSPLAIVTATASNWTRSARVRRHCMPIMFQPPSSTMAPGLLSCPDSPRITTPWPHSTMVHASLSSRARRATASTTSTAMGAWRPTCSSSWLSWPRIKLNDVPQGEDQLQFWPPMATTWNLSIIISTEPFFLLGSSQLVATDINPPLFLTRSVAYGKLGHAHLERNKSRNTPTIRATMSPTADWSDCLQ